MVAAEHDRDRTGVDDLADDVLDGGVRPFRVGGQHRRIAEVDDPQLGERVDAGLEVRPGRAARRPDRTRREPRARPVGDEIVGGRSHDRDIGAPELGGVLGVRGAAEREQPRVVGLVRQTEAAPAFEWVDHAAILADGPERVISNRAAGPDAVCRSLPGRRSNPPPSGVPQCPGSSSSPR